jgi:hypothetical protein
MHIVHSYHLLDSAFVDSWNEASEAPASTLTYTALQRQLSLPHPSHLALTDIQKADILVTQQWLRLIVWQSSMRQGLLSSSAEDESMTFRYPLKIAHSLLSVISSLSTISIEVHGMAIFEKIFEIGNTMLDVMQACGPNIPLETYGVAQDPFEMFVRTLSQTPNSQRQYANLLLAKAAEKPETQRFTQNLVPALTAHDPMFATAALPVSTLAPGTSFDGLEGFSSEAVAQRPPWRGSIVGEIDDSGEYKVEDGAEEGLEDDMQVWNDNTVWVTDTSNDGESVMSGGGVWM